MTVLDWSPSEARSILLTRVIGFWMAQRFQRCDRVRRHSGFQPLRYFVAAPSAGYRNAAHALLAHEGAPLKLRLGGVFLRVTHAPKATPAAP
jgi:hypothetical protein